MKVLCPYCGNLFTSLEKSDCIYIERCDIEDTEGCDRAFVVNVLHHYDYNYEGYSTHHTIEYKSHKIEGDI